MSAKKRITGLDMGIQDAPPSEVELSPEEHSRRDAQLRELVKTGMLPKKKSTTSMRGYRIPDDLLKLMDKEVYESRMAGGKLNLNQIVVEALQARYSK